MKKTFLIPMIAVAATVTTLVSCMKTDDVQQCTSLTLAEERTIIDSFINDNGISDISYQENYYLYAKTLSEGEGELPGTADSVSVSRKITLLNGTEIANDTLAANGNKTFAFNLLSETNTPLEYYAVSRLKQDGEMMLIIPSTYYGYAYGCTGAKNNSGVTVIPPNAQLIYTFKQLKVVKK